MNLSRWQGVTDSRLSSVIDGLRREPAGSRAVVVIPRTIAPDRSVTPYAEEASAIIEEKGRGLTS